MARPRYFAPRDALALQIQRRAETPNGAESRQSPSTLRLTRLRSGTISRGPHANRCHAAKAAEKKQLARQRSQMKHRWGMGGPGDARSAPVQTQRQKVRPIAVWHVSSRS